MIEGGRIGHPVQRISASCGLLALSHRLGLLPRASPCRTLFAIHHMSKVGGRALGFLIDRSRGTQTEMTASFICMPLSRLLECVPTQARQWLTQPREDEMIRLPLIRSG